MRKIFAVAIFVFAFFAVHSQESFQFKNTLDDTSKINMDYTLAGSHYLGQIIARKMHLFKETYTYIEEGTPMSPGQKVIVLKPEIYYAVRKINTYYKKQIRKGQLDEVAAIDKLARILDISYSIFDQDTEELEEYLSNLRKPEDLEKAFEKIELI
jgi:hypothetical protein